MKSAPDECSAYSTPLGDTSWTLGRWQRNIGHDANTQVYMCKGPSLPMSYVANRSGSQTRRYISRLCRPFIHVECNIRPSAYCGFTSDLSGIQLHTGRSGSGPLGLNDITEQNRTKP